MATLQEGDFELDGFLLSGSRRSPLYVMALARGNTRDRSQDQENPIGDTILLGRDFRTPAGWAFSLRLGHGDVTVARENLEAVARAWDEAPRGPGETSILRYRLDGEVRRMYGRARNFNPDPSLLWAFGRVLASAEFHASDRLHYTDAAQSLTLQLLKPSAGGFRFPLRFPALSSPSANRQGIITVEGSAPTPPTIRIYGPVLNPRVSSTGWAVGLTTTLAHDQNVLVDTRLGTVRRSDGANLSGSLTRESYLPEARLRPGAQEIIFSGTDPTGTARCAVSWRPAYYGL